METLLDEIKRRVPPEVRATRDVHQVTALLNDGRTIVVERRIGEIALCDALGGDRGTEVLDKLRALSAGTTGVPEAMARKLRYVVKWLDNDELDVGHRETRASIDQLVPLVFTAAEAAAIKALAERPAPVSEYDVRCACWSDDGEWLA